MLQKSEKSCNAIVCTLLHSKVDFLKAEHKALHLSSASQPPHFLPLEVTAFQICPILSLQQTEQEFK